MCMKMYLYRDVPCETMQECVTVMQVPDPSGRRIRGEVSSSYSDTVGHDESGSEVELRVRIYGRNGRLA
jgi:hypothetical protein